MRSLTYLLRDKKAAALVEYGLLVAGIALVTVASVSIFGHKTNDLLAVSAGVFPSAHVDDNSPIASGRLIETTDSQSIANQAGDPSAVLDLNSMLQAGVQNTNRQERNFGFDPNLVEEMVVDTQ